MVISERNHTDLAFSQPDASIKCVIFDFAGTLCSEGYFKSLESKYYHAAGDLIFGKNSAKWCDPWCAGELSSRDIADYLSTVWPLTSGQILQGLREGCSRMNFNQSVWQFALRQREAGLKLALVTINMDVFTEVVVPSHGLDQVFDVIINSSDYHEMSKEVLFRKAFERLGTDEFGFHNSLLIDDNERNVNRFRELGGQAFHYTDAPMRG